MPYFINGTVLSHPINYQENSNLSNSFTNQILNLRRENEHIIELATEGKASNNALKAKELTQFNLNGPTYIIKDNIFKAENWTIKEEN